MEVDVVVGGSLEGEEREGEGEEEEEEGIRSFEVEAKELSAVHRGSFG